MKHLLVWAVFSGAALLRVTAASEVAATEGVGSVFTSRGFSPDLRGGGLAAELLDDEREVSTGEKPSEADESTEEDLLTWATRQPFFQQQLNEQLPIAVPHDTQLLVGVKSAVLSGFSARQLIRQTWADRRRLPLGAHVVFLGCEPNLSVFDRDQQREWRHALDIEKATYGDLLTHELACEDSYWSLVHKVKGFLRWTTRATLPVLKYVMMADDDVYIRVDRLFDVLVVNSRVPRKGFYGGQVIATQFRQMSTIERDPLDKNFVPLEEYPMKYKPPFASGAHYLFSVDIVYFLSRNYAFLKGVGTLEDVSVTYWLLALRQIRAIHISEFENVRFKLCHNSLFSYAELTPSAIRQMHTNLQRNRSLCDGFSFHQADKRTLEMRVPDMALSGPLRWPEPLKQDWSLQYNVSAHTLQVTLSISTSSNESLDISFKPTQSNIASVCSNVRRGAIQTLPTTALRSDFCVDLYTRLSQLIHEAASEASASSYVFALARNNLLHGSSSAAVDIRLTRRVVHLRLLLECVFAAAFPDAHVEMYEETESTAIQPDIVVADILDLQSAGGAFITPALSRLVVISEGAAPGQVLSQHGNLVLLVASSSGTSADQQQPHQLYLPTASSSFANRRNHSPRALPKKMDRLNSPETREAVGFCACKDAKESQSTNPLATFTAALNARGLVTAARCKEALTMSAFHHDAEVERCRQFKFAVVFEDDPDTPGSIGHEIVSAFLAGSIPIYYGHSPTASWLFNPKAFLDCRSFESLEACAAEVTRVRSSADLYEAMRLEPPVVNHTAFVEVFSWHPDTISLAESGVETAGRMAGRFLKLLLRV